MKFERSQTSERTRSAGSLCLVQTEEATIEDLDEAMVWIQSLLADPRLIPRRRKILMGELDSLLDARLELANKEQ